MPKSLQEQAAEACIAIATMKKPNGKPIQSEVFLAAGIGEKLIAQAQPWKVDELVGPNGLHWCSERGRRDCAFLKRSDAEAYARYKNRQAIAPSSSRSTVYDWSSFMPLAGGGSWRADDEPGFMRAAALKEKQNTFVRLLARWLRHARAGFPPGEEVRNAALDLIAASESTKR